MARSSAPSPRKPRAAKPKPEPTTTKEIEVPKTRAPRELSAEHRAVVDRILAMRREGKGLPTIAKTLNDEGVKPFGKGEKWYPPVVRGICLRNGVERGAA